MTGRRWARLRSTALCVAVALLAHAPAPARAEQAPRWRTGLRFSFMPVGTFALNYFDSFVGSVDSARTICALGFGAFLDYSFNPYLAVGVGPDAVLNVIPDVPHYDGGHMFNIAARVRLSYPLTRRLRLHATITPGYGVIFKSLDTPRGFTVGGYAGSTLHLSRMHAVFLEVGYLAGFQRTAGDHPGERYSPSYLVTSCGWQLSI
jgi:hypothetical protein